jgi:hypothetical protein
MLYLLTNDDLFVFCVRAPIAGTFEDFLTMVIQFGFLALFAPACPLAPLIALANNVIELRMDAIKVCTLYRRPVWARCDTIGAWNSVMKVLALIAVATNATMIFFVGSRMVEPGTREEESISERIKSTELWIYVVLFEHGLVCLKAGLATVAPTQPRWVTDAKEVLEVRKTQMKTKEELNQMSLEVRLPGLPVFRPSFLRLCSCLAWGRADNNHALLVVCYTIQ